MLLEDLLHAGDILNPGRHPGRIDNVVNLPRKVGMCGRNVQAPSLRGLRPYAVTDVRVREDSQAAAGDMFSENLVVLGRDTSAVPCLAE